MYGTACSDVGRRSAGGAAPYQDTVAKPSLMPRAFSRLMMIAGDSPVVRGCTRPTRPEPTAAAVAPELAAAAAPKLTPAPLDGTPPGTAGADVDVAPDVAAALAPPVPAEAPGGAGTPRPAPMPGVPLHGEPTLAAAA